MSVEEIFSSEERNDENLYDIHFYMEGSFWRAYEWSAYLSRFFPSELNDDERLKVVKKLPKDYENGYVLVGLQLSSFEKYFPNVIDNEDIFKMEDKHIIIHSKEFFKDKDFTDYKSILAEWKTTINASQKEKKNHRQGELDKESFTDINSFLEEIVSYAIESKSLVENLLFLSMIREKAIKITKHKKMNT